MLSFLPLLMQIIRYFCLSCELRGNHKYRCYAARMQAPSFKQHKTSSNTSPVSAALWVEPAFMGPQGHAKSYSDMTARTLPVAVCTASSAHMARCMLACWISMLHGRNKLPCDALDASEDPEERWSLKLFHKVLTAAVFGRLTSTWKNSSDTCRGNL